MAEAYSIEVLLGKVADALLRTRLNQNLTQQVLADRSGISLKAVVNLESGHGASLKSFLSVCRTLGQLGWIDTITPPEGPSPMELLKLAGRPRRQRASGVRKGA